MLRTEEWKICPYAEDQGELFDLRTDPYEMDNKFDDPSVSHIKTILMQRLTQRMMCLGQMPEALPKLPV